MLLGYARVSTNEQKLDLQLDALTQAGCDPSHIYTDKISGSKASRPELDDMLRNAREDDTIVVWKLDRLGRSLANLIELVGTLEKRGIGFKSIHEQIDTTSSNGRLIFHIFCSLAEFERDLIRERTNAGLAAAKARGRVGGRKKKLDDDKKARAQELYDAGTLSVPEICSTLGISKPTLYRYINKRGTNTVL